MADVHLPLTVDEVRDYVCAAYTDTHVFLGDTAYPLMIGRDRTMSHERVLDVAAIWGECARNPDYLELPTRQHVGTDDVNSWFWRNVDMSHDGIITPLAVVTVTRTEICVDRGFQHLEDHQGLSLV